MNEVAVARDKKLIVALLSEPTNEAAFASVGLSATAGYARLRDPTFRAEFAAAASEVSSAALTQLKGSTGKVVGKMLSLLDSSNEQIALRAAVALLDNITRRMDDGQNEATEYARLVNSVLAELPDETKRFIAKRLREESGRAG